MEATESRMEVTPSLLNGDGLVPPGRDTYVASSPEFDGTIRLPGMWQTAASVVPATLVVAPLHTVFQGDVERELAALWIETLDSSKEYPVLLGDQNHQRTNLAGAIVRKIGTSDLFTVISESDRAAFLSPVTQRLLQERSAFTCCIRSEYAASLEVTHELEKLLEGLRYSDKAPRRSTTRSSQESTPSQEESREQTLLNLGRHIAKILLETMETLPSPTNIGASTDKNSTLPKLSSDDIEALRRQLNVTNPR